MSQFAINFGALDFDLLHNMKPYCDISAYLYPVTVFIVGI